MSDWHWQGTAGESHIAHDTAPRRGRYTSSATLVRFLILMCAILLAGCGPSVDSKDPAKRRIAVRSVTDQDVLANIALTDPSCKVRCAAIENIVSQSMLAQIVQAGVMMCGEAQCAAIEKITDQSLLGRIVLEHDHHGARNAAVQKLTDNRLLSTLALEDESPAIRAAAVASMTDQTALATIALHGKQWKTREAARAKLTDQAEIANVIVEQTSSHASAMLLSRLTDQEALGKVAAYDEDPVICAAAVEKLVHQPSLAVVAATHNRDWDTPWTAMKKLYDQQALARVLIDNVDGEDTQNVAMMYYFALNKLNDQDLLLSVALSGGARRFRRDAASKLVDHNCVIKLVKESKDYLVQATALYKLTDQSMLAAYALDKHQWNEVRIAAMANIADQSILRQVAFEKADSRNYEVIRAAIRSITDIDLLETIGEEISHSQFRDVARSAAKRRKLAASIRSIKDQSALAEYALDRQQVDCVRIAAIANLVEQSVLSKVATEFENGTDDSKQVRIAAIRKLVDIETLDMIAKGEGRNHAWPVRNVAREVAASRRAEEYREHQRPPTERLGVADETLYNIAIGDGPEWSRMKAASAISSGVILGKLALDASSLAVMVIAVEKLQDQSLLSDIAGLSRDWHVRKVALRKLSPEAMRLLWEGSPNQSVRLACGLLLGDRSWADVARSVLQDGADPTVFLNANALAGYHSDAAKEVVRVCHFCIREGDESQVSALSRLLLLYGDKALAEDYINCGNATLARAGERWGALRGMEVRGGGGSGRVAWGGS